VSGFIYEAGLLALIGSIIGGVITLVTSFVLVIADVQMPPPPGRTDGYPLNIYFSVELLAYCSVGVMVICIFAAWISARKGVNKPITEALVYV